MPNVVIQKFTCKGTLRQGFICLWPPNIGFVLGWCSNFVGSESGQKQSVKLLHNMVSNTTNNPHPLPATYCLYILYFDFWKGGGADGDAWSVRQIIYKGIRIQEKKRTGTV
jgi:hypothetical protein